MKAPLARAARLLGEAKVEGDEVVGRLRGHEVRFGLYADGHDEPEEVWAVYVLVDTGALDCSAFIGDVGEHVATGDLTFDAEVALTANLPDAAVRLFDAPLRTSMLTLRFRLDCCQGVRVAKYRYRTAEADLPVEAMLTTALDAAERVLELVREGIVPRVPLPPLRAQMKREKMTSALPFILFLLVLFVALGAGAAALHYMR